MAMTDAHLDNWFTYHAPSADQLPKYLAIREAGRVFAAVVIANTPESADQSVAIRKIRETVMISNQAIACGGK